MKPAFGAVLGVALGLFAGRLHHVVPGGVTARYAGIYAVGFGLVAFGLADVTFGNGLVAAFVFGITLGLSDHEITERFTEFSENISAIFQVVTFFVFGALIVATGYDASIAALAAFIAYALLVARPVAVELALAGTKIPRPHKAFIAWFGPKGVASMLFALLILDSEVGNRTTLFDVASFVILASIVLHGLTDTVGARWIARRMETRKKRADRPQPDRGRGHAARRDRRRDCRRGAGDEHKPHGRCRDRRRPGTVSSPPPPLLHPPVQAGRQPAPLVARLDGRVIASTNDLVGGACRAGTVDKLRSLPALLMTGPRSATGPASGSRTGSTATPTDPTRTTGRSGSSPTFRARGSAAS